MVEMALPQQVRDRIIARRGRLHAFETLDPKRTALLVVDLQDAFMKPESPFELPAARNIVDNVNLLSETVRRTGGHVVFVVSTYGPDPADRWPVLFDLILSSERGQLFRDWLSVGSEGHAIWNGLDHLPEDSVVSKNRFGGFIGSNGELEALLRGRGVDTVLVVGTVTTVCCESTAREAVMYNFRTIMIDDGNAGRHKQSDLHAFCNFIEAFGDVRDTQTTITLLEAGT